MQECINLSGLLHLTKTIAPGEVHAHKFTANGGAQELLSELAGTEDEVRCGGSAVKVVSLRYITQPEPGRPSEIEVFLEGVKYLNGPGATEETEPPPMDELDIKLKEGQEKHISVNTTTKEVIKASVRADGTLVITGSGFRLELNPRRTF